MPKNKNIQALISRCFVRYLQRGVGESLGLRWGSGPCQMHFSLLTHRVFSGKSCHHADPWIPRLENKLVGLDMFICKYKAWALEDPAYLALKPVILKTSKNAKRQAPQAYWVLRVLIALWWQHLEKRKHVLSDEGQFSGRIFGKCSLGKDWKHLKNVDRKLLGLSLALPGTQLSILSWNTLFSPCQSHSQIGGPLFSSSREIPGRTSHSFVSECHHFPVILVLGLFTQWWWLTATSYLAWTGFPLRGPSAAASQACLWHILGMEIWNPQGFFFTIPLSVFFFFFSELWHTLSPLLGDRAEKYLEGLSTGWSWAMRMHLILKGSLCSCSKMLSHLLWSLHNCEHFSLCLIRIP